MRSSKSLLGANSSNTFSLRDNLCIMTFTLSASGAIRYHWIYKSVLSAMRSCAKIVRKRSKSAHFVAQQKINMMM